MVHAINDLEARGKTDAYRAAVVSIGGNRIWLEYRTGNDGGLGNYRYNHRSRLPRLQHAIA